MNLLDSAAKISKLSVCRAIALQSMVRYYRLLNVFFRRFPVRLDLKIIFNIQNGKFLSIVRLSFVLKSSEALPKYGKTQINSLLGTVKLRSLWTNSLFKNFLIQ